MKKILTKKSWRRGYDTPYIGINENQEIVLLNAVRLCDIENIINLFKKSFINPLDY